MVSHIHLVNKVAYDVFRQVIDGDVGVDMKRAAGHREECNWREPPRPNMNQHCSKSHTTSPNDIKPSNDIEFSGKRKRVRCNEGLGLVNPRGVNGGS